MTFEGASGVEGLKLISRSKVKLNKYLVFFVAKISEVMYVSGNFNDQEDVRGNSF